MAYAAVISLKRTIKRFLNSSHISIASSSREIIEFAYREAESLQEVLKRLDDSRNSGSKRLNALDGQMREEVHKLEDLLEFRVSDQFLSQCESYGDGESSSRILPLHLEEVEQEINSFAESMKEMKEEYTYELCSPSPEEEEDHEGAAVSSSIGSVVDMVGLSDEFFNVKCQTLKGLRPDDFGVFATIGTTGTGRTFLARRVDEDLYINGGEQYFDCGAWVTIGPSYQLKEILLRIIAQMDGPSSYDGLLGSGEDGEIAEYLYRRLLGRRYMIVLDDVCDAQIWDYLKRSFPCQHNGSLVLLTSNLEEVALLAHCFYILRPMSENECLDILRMVMFGLESSIPPELEEAAKKIVSNCGGLPVSLAKVLLFLQQADKTPEYWNKIAADEQNSIFIVAHEIFEIYRINEQLQQQFDLFRDNEMNFDIIPATGNEVGLPTFFLYAMIVRPLSRVIELLKAKMFPKRVFPRMEVISFIGMTGIGKTTFVKKFFEDQLILHCFNHRAWITLGPRYQSKDILVDILAQIYPGTNKMSMKVDAKLVKDLCAKLSNKRCLIVLDDVRNKEPLYFLRKLFPDIKGKTLVTTRLEKDAHFEKFDSVHEMRFLNKEESWFLLCQKVFAEELCPPELEKAGKKIAENCEGLPLTIVTVANILSKAEKCPEYWNKVAEENSSLFINAYDEISKGLLPSYKSIPQHLKACILYMGVFPKKYEIPTSKLINLLIAERFLEPNSYQIIEDFAAKCLSELVDRSLVMVCQKGSNLGVKTYRLHSVFWYLSNSEAMKHKFFHAFNTYANNSIDGMKDQRRLCIRNGILFGIKDVQNSVASISTAHSLLCTGPPPKYPVPICFKLRLLRILEALIIRLYEFPTEVMKLIHLTYLALTCNGKLPASISKLWNLEYLIINQHLSIISLDDSSYLPIEIWDMKGLKHLQIMGRCLLNPNSGSLLPNLCTLLDVDVHSCTKRVLKAIRNLKRLRIRIEMTLDADGKCFHGLNRISRLRKLKSLKCVVVNPELTSKVVVPPSPCSMFPCGLKKLSLSGLGYPWEYMSIIGKLQNLEVLKLRCYAFQGPSWKTGDGDFINLKFLYIEDTDLVCWQRALLSLVALKHLSMKHCYKLEEPPCHFGNYIEMIEVVDCNPLVVSWAKQIQEMNFVNPSRNTHLKAHVHSTWDAPQPQVMTASLIEKE